jgi:hypothetical protein
LIAWRPACRFLKVAVTLQVDREAERTQVGLLRDVQGLFCSDLPAGHIAEVAACAVSTIASAHA